MSKFSKWVHPKTGEVRVYVSNLPRAGFAKIYLKEGTARADGKHDWDFVVLADRGVLNCSRNDISNSIDFALKELDGGEGYINTFERVLELAK